jgi:hypothetical protein
MPGSRNCGAEPAGFSRGDACLDRWLGYTCATVPVVDEEDMAAIDPEFERHRRTWIGFTRLIKYAIATIVVILAGMAIFLL